jgi:hypothetical protein
MLAKLGVTEGDRLMNHLYEYEADTWLDYAAEWAKLAADEPDAHGVARLGEWCN